MRSNEQVESDVGSARDVPVFGEADQLGYQLFT